MGGNNKDKAEEVSQSRDSIAASNGVLRNCCLGMQSALRQYYDPITYLSCPNALSLRPRREQPLVELKLVITYARHSYDSQIIAKDSFRC